jgi:predicted RNA binding protein YcfA (HicA-like mRNA interferase family)
MPPLPVVSGSECVRTFEKVGWVVDRQRCSHLILIRRGSRVTLSVPLHRELAPGTLRSLIRASAMTVEEFIGLL